MAAEVTMPKLTDSMEEGQIVAWKVQEGDRVEEGEVLAEIETDKAVMELESFWSGTLVEILHQGGDVVAVGTVIARIDEQGGATAKKTEGGGQDRQAGRKESPDREAAQGAAEQGGREGEGDTALEQERKEPGEEEGEEQDRGGAGDAPQRDDETPASDREETAAEPPSRTAPAAEGGQPGAVEIAIPGGRTRASGQKAAANESAGSAAVDAVRASPRARRMAAEAGLDLGDVEATGSEDQVTAEDVQRARDHEPEPRPDQSGAATEQRSGQAAADRADEELPAIQYRAEEADTEEVSFYQKSAIRRVVASKHVIPHFYVTRQVRADKLLEHKQQEAERSGASLTHLLMRACALALEEFPDVNRSYDRGHWIRWKMVHLGLAVQTDAGLVVAVVRDAAGRELHWLAEKTRALVEKARQGRLESYERANPTFTISNLGAYDVDRFAAIINPPSAITLAVGTVRETPVVEDGEVRVGRAMNLTLSCDHRVVDGVLAARFLARLAALLEEPEDL